MGIKRIIDGKAYNTETASLICTPAMRILEAGINPEEHLETIETLYQTKHGAFFIAWEHSVFGFNGIKPLSEEEAHAWMEKWGVDADIIEKALGTAFPEAGAAESRITLRLPGNLHNRVTASAEAAGLSVNTYIMRLLERSEIPTATNDR